MFNNISHSSTPPPPPQKKKLPLTVTWYIDLPSAKSEAPINKFIIQINNFNPQIG